MPRSAESAPGPSVAISRLPGPQQVLMVLMVLIRINRMAINTPGWKFYALMVLMDLFLRHVLIEY
jgi:hypothetical protein